MQLEKKINADLKKDKKEISISVSAYIHTVTKFEKLQSVWGEGKGTTKEEFSDNKVLFIENDKKYLTRIFDNL